MPNNLKTYKTTLCLESELWYSDPSLEIGPTSTFYEAMENHPDGPCVLVVDDTLAESFLVPASEVQSAEITPDYLSWKYSQILGQESSAYVHGTRQKDQSLILTGLAVATYQQWSETSLSLKHSIQSIQPRWSFLYDQIKEGSNEKGLLLSLNTIGANNYQGTLVAWNEDIHLLRQWSAPLTLAQWSTERITPTLGYLAKINQSPEKIYVYKESADTIGLVSNPVILDRSIFWQPSL